MASGATVCFGIIIMVCQPQAPRPVTSDFCNIIRPQIGALHGFSPAELTAMPPARKRALLALRRQYEALCH